MSSNVIHLIAQFSGLENHDFFLNQQNQIFKKFKWLVGASNMASMCRVSSHSKDEKKHFVSSVETAAVASPHKI